MNLVWNAPDGAGGYVARLVLGRVDPAISQKTLAQAGRWRRRLRAHREGDAAWDWARFLKDFSKSERTGGGRYAFYSLWAMEEVQALMILETSGEHRLTRESKLPQIYVEYLTVNPDHRSALRQPRKVLGCGLALLTVAVNESARRGWSGRVGLHSLPGAVGFYQKQGFKDLGKDPAEEGCTYMELAAMLLGG